jgi:phosphomannomutase
LRAFAPVINRRSDFSKVIVSRSAGYGKRSAVMRVDRFLGIWRSGREQDVADAEDGSRMTGGGTRIATVSGLRGIVGDGLDPAGVCEFAAAYAGACDPGPIIVSHDGRVSAPMFVAAVEAAVRATGHDVWLAGATATPTVGFLVRQAGAAGAIQVSASHNPPQYNGMKFFQRIGMVLSQSQGLDLLARLENRDFGWKPWNALGGSRVLEDPDGGHLARVLEIVDVAAIRNRKFRVVLDACHGAGGRMGTALLRALGCEPVVLGSLADGHYDHPPEPTSANLGSVAAVVPALGAAVGFAQDPDADRLAIIDENGRYIGEELTLALAAKRRLAQECGPVVLNLSTSRVTNDIAAERGCAVIRTPVGEAHVVQGMLAENAVLAGEGNGGVIDPRVGLVRDSFVAIALVLDLMAETGLPLSRLVDSLPRYAMVKQQYPLKPADHSPGESSRASVAARDAARWESLASAYPEAQADFRDGLRLDWHDRWVHVRSSNTEPIVRVIAEGKEAQIANDLAADVGRRLGEATERAI